VDLRHSLTSRPTPRLSPRLRIDASDSIKLNERLPARTAKSSSTVLDQTSHSARVGAASPKQSVKRSARQGGLDAWLTRLPCRFCRCAEKDPISKLETRRRDGWPLKVQVIFHIACTATSTNGGQAVVEARSRSPALSLALSGARNLFRRLAGEILRKAVEWPRQSALATVDAVAEAMRFFSGPATRFGTWAAQMRIPDQTGDCG